MRFYNLFTILKRTQMLTNAFIRHKHIYSNQFIVSERKFLSSVVRNVGTIQDDSFEEIDYASYISKIDDGNVRDLLFKNTKDLLLDRIYCCASVQELFKVLDTNAKYYKTEHITQTVLVLYDLMKIYCDVNCSKQSAKLFSQKLNESSVFHKLLQLTEENLQNFDEETLSYALLYLNKLGVSVETKLMQEMSDSLKTKLLQVFSISGAARFLESAFSDNSLRSSFMSLELVPLLLNEIDSCDSVEKLNHLSVSLNKLHNFVSDNDLNKYKNKVKSMLKDEKITATDCQLILQIISLLNYPKWRDRNSVLMSQCILLIKDNLNSLSINEILLLYEIFFKIQEPGEILGPLQRSTATHFHKLDESATTQKVTLLYTLIYYASPHLKTDFQKTVARLVKQCDDIEDLLLLRKPFSYLKISDTQLCRLYWDKMLKFLQADRNRIDILKLCQSYMAFNMQTDNYRHHEFERETIKILNNISNDTNYSFFPHKLADVLNFVLLYDDDLIFLEHLVNKLETNWGQLRHSNTLRLALTLKTFDEMDKNYIKLPYAQRMNKVFKKIVSKQMEGADLDKWTLNALLKACIYKKTIDSTTLDKLLHKFTVDTAMSSKIIEHVVYCFLNTSTLLPDIIDRMTDYIVTYKDNVLGFNVGKTLYLCYVLGYQPKNAENFFETAIDTIIRNQERMTGLAIIYSALSLCFFNKLTNSIIKSIFNVEFMDKLDKELQNCYSKDKYPQRVRNYLMQLNRAVCLDYPESNVPWFHQKYVEQGIADKKKRNHLFINNVREYLKRIVFNTNALAENVVTPYGYTIDFVIYLDPQDEIAIDPTEFSRRLAMLLVPEHSYTRFMVQLMGQTQLKKRHLEILGYKVVTIKYSHWITLFYAEERLNFLTNLIWPKNCSNVNKRNSI